jgi:rhodanese-related sulfurtransferase
MSSFDQFDVTPSEVQQARERGDAFTLLDVREPFELAIARVADAVAIPMNDIPARVGELDSALPVVCLCHHGGRSTRVALWLRSRGFTTHNVEGGIEAWATTVDPSLARY